MKFSNPLNKFKKPISHRNRVIRNSKKTKRAGFGKKNNHKILIDERYALNVESFAKGFNDYLAVKGVDFKVSRGVIHGFLGPNGSGKTTTIKTIIGSMIPSRGTIRVFGNFAGSVESKRLIGYIPESARFPKGMSTFEYLITMARLSGVSVRESIPKVQKILTSTGLLKFKNKNPNFFSSGMQKKILLAQALLNDPELLILDEPAENLDPTTRAQLYSQLVSLKNEGKTIFISSHVLAELENIVSEITILDYGELRYNGRVTGLMTGGIGSYSLITNDNSRLVRILKTNGFPCRIDGEYVVTKLESDEQKYIVQKIITDNHLVLKVFLTRQRTLQDVYNYLVAGSQKTGGVI